MPREQEMIYIYDDNQQDKKEIIPYNYNRIEPIFDDSMSDGVKWFIRGALESRYNAKHWFMYLGKMIHKDGHILLSPEEIEQLYSNNQLTMFQRATMKRATTKGTKLYEYVWGLGKPARLKALEKFVQQCKEKGITSPKIKWLEEKIAARNKMLQEYEYNLSKDIESKGETNGH